jgi:hypothetical protein
MTKQLLSQFRPTCLYPLLGSVAEGVNLIRRFPRYLTAVCTLNDGDEEFALPLDVRMNDRAAVCERMFCFHNGGSVVAANGGVN